MPRHWSEDPYWTEAAERFYDLREKGAKQLVIDLDAIGENLYNGDGPAYRALEAMLSVDEHEGMDGCRGAPRIVLALLQILSEHGHNSKKEQPCQDSSTS
jgi:hypothetical protein